MDDSSKSDASSEGSQSRWSRAIGGAGEDRREALKELAGSYWYSVYAWWRRSGLDAAHAATATLASFSRWLDDSPPLSSDSGSERLREWLRSRLADLLVSGVKPEGEAPIAIDPAWAETRYADEPEGATEAIFQRRWALTVLEFTTKALQSEYAARGEAKLFEELLAFAGFEPSDDERYATVASRTGLTSGAMRKAVFDFRTRHRELLRGVVADTVANPADIESEITALLIACDAVGPHAATAPLPTVLQSLQPDQVLARAMNSARMSSAGANGWTPPSIDEASRLFPNYKVIALLGRGGMGAVYQACQTSLDRLVAIKLLPLEISVEKDFADRFRREARAMAKLSHPNIISVFDFGQTSEGHLYFVMEFIDGAMLHTLIHGGNGSAAPNLQPAEALKLVEQVCDALAYAHEKGVIHRDIKPANVMVDRQGHVKVADFGLARMAEADPAQWGTTMTGVVMGTPDYVATEQKRGLHVDHRADIYSLGVMLYEMLCKETPQGVFKLPSKHCGLDKRLDGIITKALASKPEERFQSTAEMKTAIEIVRPAVAKAQAKKPKPVPKPAQASYIPAPPNSALVKAVTVLAGAAKISVPRAAKKRTSLFIGLAICLATIVALAALVIPKLRHGNAAASGASGQGTSAPPIAATKDAPFVNSLGMKFVPVPIIGGPTSEQRVLFSVWDTRVQDYEAFVQETNREWPKVDFPQGPTHPAVQVSWEDAQLFCQWLTVREQKAGRLPLDWRYRLPSDHEWSCAVGIGDREDAAITPAEKNGKLIDLFPWGTQWPPPAGAGTTPEKSCGPRLMQVNSPISKT